MNPGVQAQPLGPFYTHCGVVPNHTSPDSGFFVIPMPDWPTTSWICKNWGSDPAIANPQAMDGPLPNP